MVQMKDSFQSPSSPVSSLISPNNIPADRLATGSFASGSSGRASPNPHKSMPRSAISPVNTGINVAAAAVAAGDAQGPKTKFVCTIGPASCSKECLTELIEEGMSIARLNMVHCTYDVSNE
jgi:hypothetical protein